MTSAASISMKSAVGILAALMSSVAFSAHAHPGGMGGMQGGMMARMGQGLHGAGAQGGSEPGYPHMGAGHRGMGGARRGMASAQRRQAGEGPVTGGCPMMGQNSTQSRSTR